MLRFQIACRRNFRSVVIVACELYLYAENVDRVVAKAVSLGATAQGQVMYMFWGDRVRSKLKCPLFVASEVSGLGF
jgi:uncharacterized glyoxalase superfamily protein PhnB